MYIEHCAATHPSVPRGYYISIGITFWHGKVISIHNCAASPLGQSCPKLCSAQDDRDHSCSIVHWRPAQRKDAAGQDPKKTEHCCTVMKSVGNECKSYATSTLLLQGKWEGSLASLVSYTLKLGEGLAH